MPQFLLKCPTGWEGHERDFHQGYVLPWERVRRRGRTRIAAEEEGREKEGPKWNLLEGTPGINSSLCLLSARARPKSGNPKLEKKKLPIEEGCVSLAVCPTNTVKYLGLKCWCKMSLCISPQVASQPQACPHPVPALKGLPDTPRIPESPSGEGLETL